MDWDKYCNTNASAGGWVVPVAIALVVLGVVVLLVVL